MIKNLIEKEFENFKEDLIYSENNFEKKEDVYKSIKSFTNLDTKEFIIMSDKLLKNGQTDLLREKFLEQFKKLRNVSLDIEQCRTLSEINSFVFLEKEENDILSLQINYLKNEGLTDIFLLSFNKKDKIINLVVEHKSNNEIFGNFYNKKLKKYENYSLADRHQVLATYDSLNNKFIQTYINFADSLYYLENKKVFSYTINGFTKEINNIITNAYYQEDNNNEMNLKTIYYSSTFSSKPVSVFKILKTKETDLYIFNKKELYFYKNGVINLYLTLKNSLKHT